MQVRGALRSRIPEISDPLLGSSGEQAMGITYGNHFPATFPTDFACPKLAEKVANGSPLAVGHCKCCKCKLVTKHMNCNHVTARNSKNQL